MPLPVLLALAAWGGTGAALLALAGNEAVLALLPSDARTVFGDAIAPPLVEELAKGLALALAVVLSARLAAGALGWRFEGPVAGLLCGAAVGVGFGFTEDFFYFVDRAGDAGVAAGADLYLGRRDFFGPAALHHSLFTAALGAGIGAAAWARSRRARVLWPLAGLAVAVAMHAVNNGLVELLLLLDHGLDAATAWVEDAPLAAAAEATADRANAVLVVLDYLYLALFAAGVLAWNLHSRRRVATALGGEVEAGLLDRGDADVVCAFGGRSRAYARLAAAGDYARLRASREYWRKVAELGVAGWRARSGRGSPLDLGERRRALLAAHGRVRSPGSVEAPASSLVGRERDLTALGELLGPDGPRLLTITGPGGCGKTRIALELAARLGPDHAHGSHFVDLSGLEQPTDVGPRVAAELVAELPEGEEPGEWLGRLLRDRETLLVLDNFEQVAPAAPLVGWLVAAAPRLRVLVTSRVPLGIGGESEYPLAPLSLEAGDSTPSAAATLFLERARERGRAIEAGAEVAAVEAICARLDGLPLAIELVAARAVAVPPQALRERLDRALDLAASAAAAGRPERQRTLRAAIVWSTDLLDEPTRRAFVRLAELPAGARLDRLEDAIGGEAVDAVDALVRASLLVVGSDPDGVPRYRMLATVRDLGLELGERERASPDLLPAYAVAVAASLDSGDGAGPGRAAVFDAERPNLTAAIERLATDGDPARARRLMVSLGTLWERREVEAAADLAADLIEDDRGGGDGAADHRLVGRLALLCGRYRQAGESLRTALAADPGRALGFSARCDLGWVAVFGGDLADAEAAFGAALELARAGLGPAAEAQALSALGRVRAERGDPGGGAELAHRGLALRRQGSDVRGRASALSTVARVTLLAGDNESARREGAGALALATELGDRLRQAEALLPLSLAALLDGSPEAAGAAARRRLDLCRDLGDRLGIAEILDLCALLSGERGDSVQANAACAAATGLRAVLGAPRLPWDRDLLESRLGEGAASATAAALGASAALDLARDCLDRLATR